MCGRDAVQCRVDCCENDKHSSGRLRQKAILDGLRQEGGLIYGRPPMSQVRLFLQVRK